MAETPASIRIAAAGCVTPLGDAQATHAALLRGECALKALPVRGREGGDLVPLALLPGRELDETAPPAWMSAIHALAAKLPPGEWGSPSRPVFVTGSNFGVGGLYALRRSGDKAFGVWGAPPTCTEELRRALGWGSNVSILSLACVSAHLGLLEATRLIHAGLADEALVLSFDFLSPFVAGGFHALKILNSGFPAPYTEGAAGAIGLGDGAAFAVLSRDRGDWRIEGQSVFNEMHHFTSNRADGSGFDQCLGSVSRVAAGRRVWFKGHGTGTLDAGRMEVAAAAKAFPGAPVAGWKGSLGHTLGSCGLVELAVAIESLSAGSAPGTVGATGAVMSPGVAVANFNTASYDAVVCASNAFGGAHAAFLLSHA